VNEAVAPLFEPYALRGLKLANRIVMAPMTRGFSPSGVPGDDVAAYYRRRAEGGTGLIITEGVGVDHPAALGGSGVDGDNVPHMYGGDALAGWKRVIDAVHAAGGVIIPQLWHQGVMRETGTGPYPDAATVRPSGIWGPLDKQRTVTDGYMETVARQPGEPMTESEDRGRHRRVRAQCRGGNGHRLRRHRDPWRTRLYDRYLPVGRYKPSERSLGRRSSSPDQLRGRDRPRDPPRDRRGAGDRFPLLAVEAAGYPSAARRDAGRARGGAGPPGRRRRRHLRRKPALFRPPGVRGLAAQPGRLGKKKSPASSRRLSAASASPTACTIRRRTGGRQRR